MTFRDDLGAHARLEPFGDITQDDESKAQWLVRISKKGHLELSNVLDQGVLRGPNRDSSQMQVWLISASVEAEELAPWEFHIRIEWSRQSNVIKVRLP